MAHYNSRRSPADRSLEDFEVLSIPHRRNGVVNRGKYHANVANVMSPARDSASFCISKWQPDYRAFQVNIIAIRDVSSNKMIVLYFKIYKLDTGPRRHSLALSGPMLWCDSLTLTPQQMQFLRKKRPCNWRLLGAKSIPKPVSRSEQRSVAFPRVLNVSDFRRIAEYREGQGRGFSAF
jgi:hypothetical protein